jgi:hypothetical protein
VAQISDGGRKFFDAPRSPRCQYFLSFDGRLNPRQPSVARITHPLDETLFFQTGYDACHRRRLHLLRGGKLA